MEFFALQKTTLSVRFKNVFLVTFFVKKVTRGVWATIIYECIWGWGCVKLPTTKLKKYF